MQHTLQYTQLTKRNANTIWLFFEVYRFVLSARYYKVIGWDGKYCFFLFSVFLIRVKQSSHLLKSYLNVCLQILDLKHVTGAEFTVKLDITISFDCLRSGDKKWPLRFCDSISSFFDVCKKLWIELFERY